MNNDTRALKERYNKLRACYAYVRQEITKYNVDSPEFNILHQELSNINIELGLLRAKLKEIKKKSSFGNWVMGENQHSKGYKK